MRHLLPHLWWLILLFGIMGACALNSVEEGPLRVRVATWPGYAPLYAVEELHLAAPTTLEVSTSELAQDNYRAFAEHRVDVLATTLYSAIQFQAQGTDTVVILITDYSNGADGIIARPGIETVSDLQGQRVGVESGSISHFVLLRALEQAGMNETDVQVTHIGVSEAIDAIDQGVVDAAVVWEPVLSEYEQFSGLRPVFTSAAIPHEVVDVLVTRPEIIEQRADDLVNLALGWDKALQDCRTPSSEVCRVITERLDMDQTDLLQEFSAIELIDLEHNSQLLDLDHSPGIQPTFEHMIRFLQDTDQLEHTAPTSAEMLNQDIIHTALRERDTEE